MRAKNTDWQDIIFWGLLGLALIVWVASFFKGG